MKNVHRYEVCASCGMKWNVSHCQKLIYGWYICPVCTRKDAGGKKRDEKARRSKSR